MPFDSPPTDRRDKPPHLLIRLLDRLIIAAIWLLIALARLKSRDPAERAANLWKSDPRQTIRVRNWQGVLRWSPNKRVGCFAGVLIGSVIGGAVIWWFVR